MKGWRSLVLRWLYWYVDEHWFVESRNVIVRIHGTSNNLEEAILVNAHYGKCGSMEKFTV